MMLRTKYEVFRPCGFREEEFFYVIPIRISLCKICDPQSGPMFCPQGRNLSKLGRGLLDDATY